MSKHWILNLWLSSEQEVCDPTLVHQPILHGTELKNMVSSKSTLLSQPLEMLAFR